MPQHNEPATAYEGYGWIKVPKYQMNESVPWEQRYKELEQHHIQETTFLIGKVRELAAALAATQPDRP
jgi:hypothetical protein